MTETPSSDAATTTASSADVLSELMLLRQREGLTLRKIRDNCPTICSLTATSEELRRRGMPDSDRHVAAYEMMICALHRLIVRTDFLLILRSTLNLNRARQPDPPEVKSEALLSERRKQVQDDLFVTEKAYRRLEEDAYVEFAGRLVASTVSPCSEAASKQFEQRVPVDVKLFLDTETLLLLLNRISLEHRQVLQEALAERVLTVLPRAQAASLQIGRITSGDDASYFALFRALIEAVLSRSWPPVYEEWRPARRNAPGMPADFLDAASLRLSIFPNRNLARDWQAEKIRRILVSGMRVGVDRRTLRDLREMKRASFAALSELLVRVEASDGWPEVLNGNDN